MSASLSDILTALKNGVVALGDNSRFTQVILNLIGIASGFNRIAQAALTTAYVTYYTCPSNQRACITGITVCNTNNNNQHFSVSIVPSGGTAGAGNAAFFQFQVNAYETQIFDLSLPMNSLDTLQMKASATGMTLFVSGGSIV